MESRFQRILLMATWRAVFLCMPFLAAPFYSAHADDTQPNQQTAVDILTTPDVEPRKVKEAKIDSEIFDIGLYTGAMSVEDFGTNNVFGITAAFYPTDSFFIQANYGTTDTTKSSAEIVGDFDLITDEQRKLSYYNLGLGWSLFPGEAYFGKSRAFNTRYYLIAGVGNTQFAGDSFLTYNFGAGFQLLATDWLALDMGFRNHLFSHTLFVQEKSIQNLEARLGLSLFF